MALEEIFIQLRSLSEIQNGKGIFNLAFFASS